MCRLLCVRSPAGFDIADHIAALAEVAQRSREYQGHGWGCAWLPAGSPSRTWRLHHAIRPIWEDGARPAERATLLVAHARSAFRDEGIRVENNMPFCDGERVFAFNGELHGVRIRERGRIGAEKVFNFVKRFDRGDFGEALARGLDAVERRTRWMRAMNVVVAERTGAVHIASRFGEDPDYFQMHAASWAGGRVVCSAPYAEAGGARTGLAELAWSPVANGVTLAWEEGAECF